jgi:hypothetical protein
MGPEIWDVRFGMLLGHAKNSLLYCDQTKSCGLPSEMSRRRAQRPGH